jgi:hypothetical protein
VVDTNSRGQDNSDIPLGLEKWIHEHEGNQPVMQEGLAPYRESSKKFILVTCPLEKLGFNDHRFNPRTPSKEKIRELASSIASLSLLTPLTCAFIGKSKESSDNAEFNNEEVVLLDGRHRFEALKELEKDYPSWKEKARIDLKIYFNLEMSDIYLLATYLNKTRKALAKGEYYKAIVDIYDSKQEEISQRQKEGTRKMPTEKEVFSEITARDLSDKNFDLSIGRITGLTAFNEEEGGSWYPMVGLKQQDKIKTEEYQGYQGHYCPLTAGNLAQFLGHLCYSGPYDDDGSKRATEIGNVLQLGVLFREKILRPVDNYEKATGTTVACKHWPLDALGQLIEKKWGKYLILGEGEKKESLLAHQNINWAKFREILNAYFQLMEEQACLINDYRKSKSSEENIEKLKEAWSYQTQRDQILAQLEPKMKEKIEWLRG